MLNNCYSIPIPFPSSLSLRWRLLVAFGLLILLTVCLSGIIAAILTTNRFDLFVTAQGQERARRIAPYLEASYLLHGDWSGIPKLWHSTLLSDIPIDLSSDERNLVTDTDSTNTTVTDDATSDENVTSNHSTDDSFWFNDIDWVQMVADELGFDVDILWAEINSGLSLAVVAERYGLSVDDLVTKIYRAEEESVQAALAAGSLTERAVQEYMLNLEENIRADLIAINYYISYVDWNAITATQFGTTKAILLDLLRDHTIADLAQAEEVSLPQIRQAILAAEATSLRNNPLYGEADAVTLISEAVDLLDDYLGVSADADESIVDLALAPAGLLVDYLDGGERLLIAGADGQLLYDSLDDNDIAVGIFNGASLSPAMLAQGIPLHQLPTGEQVATLLVTAGPGEARNQQLAFLRGIIYSLVLSSGIAVAVALVTALWVARQVVAPVRAVTTAAQQIADGQSGERLPVTTDDELGQMSTTFNQMAFALDTQRELRQRLVNDLSHELSTPLSVIQLEMQALRDGLQTTDQAFEQVQSEIELLRNLINDLGNLETTEDLALQLEPIDLSALAHRAIKRWQAKAESKSVALSLTAADELLPLVEADSARLIQVLGILLDNGLRHTASGDTIVVHCQLTSFTHLASPISLTPTDSAKDPVVVVTVCDSGSGIPAADLPHIFERFYRVDSSRNRHSGGRGLGLAIAKQIIVAHGGQIWADSQEGRGSTFGFCLPIIELD